MSKRYKNLIFDLGGVIINLDMDRTVRMFSEMSGRRYEEIMPRFYTTELFIDFEKGLMNETYFREGINELLGTDFSDEEIDSAWNAMLLDIPEERVRLLQRLNKDHDLYLISNTNEIHVPVFNRILEKTTGLPDLSSLFKKIYYSHEVNLRKPDTDIYKLVLEENNLDPEETILIDDRLDNLKGAEHVGIDGVQVTEKYTILDHFSE